MRQFALIVSGAAFSMTTPPAMACATVILDTQRPGESSQAYEVRLAELERRAAKAYSRERQVEAFRDAKLIFIGRAVEVLQMQPMQRPAPEQTDPTTVTIKAARVQTELPRPDRFEPIAWFRGKSSSGRFDLKGRATSCGIKSIGDASHSQPGDLFLFFARKGPLSEKTLIDAIALDSIDHPTLTAFVAKHRKRPTARR